jgi:2-dehydro-3-deoxy-D-gluconate 5-dehydrogenase
MTKLFKDKVVMITGATGGIGKTIASAFARESATLSLVGGDQDMENIIPLNDIPVDRVFTQNADLSREDEIARVVNETYLKYSKIDVLINCIGINIRKKMFDYTSEDWDKIHSLNIRAIFFLNREVAKFMITHQYGKIINISSIQSQIIWNGRGKFSITPYSASKAAVDALTRSFALDLAQYNINVNSICPSVIEGEYAKGLLTDVEMKEDILFRTPLNRLCKNSDLIAPTFLFASDSSSFITGQSLMVDGGWSIG